MMPRYLLALALLLAPSYAHAWGAMAVGMHVNASTAVNPDNCTGGETIGLTSDGTSDASMNTGRSFTVGRFQAPCTGNLASAYIHSGTGGANNIKVAIYTDGDADNVPDSSDLYIAMSAAINVGSAGWKNGAFSTGSVTKNAWYWLCVYSDGSSTKTLKYNNASKYSFYATCNGYTTPKDDLGVCTQGTDNNMDLSMYVTLSAP